jgi:hypothetical protein
MVAAVYTEHAVTPAATPLRKDIDGRRAAAVIMKRASDLKPR